MLVLEAVAEEELFFELVELAARAEAVKAQTRILNCIVKILLNG